MWGIFFKSAVPVFVGDIAGNSSGQLTEECIAFLASVQRTTQPAFQALLSVLLFFFYFEVFIRSGKLFHTLPLLSRQRIVASWLSSGIRAKRDFMKLFLNLSLLASYDSDIVLDRMGILATHRKIQCFYAGR